MISKNNVYSWYDGDNDDDDNDVKDRDNVQDLH